jgi:hypothetical protein
MRIDPAQLRALASGETIVAAVDAPEVRTGDTGTLAAGPATRRTLKAAYRRWRDDPPAGHWTAEVVSVHTPEEFEPEAFAARHLFADHPEGGSVIVLRVADGAGPVLSDVAFTARRRSLARALR